MRGGVIDVAPLGRPAGQCPAAAKLAVVGMRHHNQHPLRGGRLLLALCFRRIGHVFSSKQLAATPLLCQPRQRRRVPYARHTTTESIACLPGACQYDTITIHFISTITQPDCEPLHIS